MSDIVKRLQEPAYWISSSNEGHEGESDVPREDADTITRLTAEVERLKKEIIGRQAHDRMQVREIKHLTAEVERLRAELLDREIDAQLRCEKIIRLEEELSLKDTSND